MVDIAHIWNADIEMMYGDWLIDPPDLASDADLRTAVIISLFSDALAAEDDVLPDPSAGNRRGYWGDTGTTPPDNTGSKLWLYTRSKWTDEVRLGIENTAREALAWMIEDGAADEVIVQATRSSLGRIDLSVVIVRDNNRIFASTYGWAWAQQFGGP